MSSKVKTVFVFFSKWFPYFFVSQYHVLRIFRYSSYILEKKKKQQIGEDSLHFKKIYLIIWRTYEKGFSLFFISYYFDILTRSAFLQLTKCIKSVAEHASNFLHETVRNYRKFLQLKRNPKFLQSAILCGKRWKQSIFSDCIGTPPPPTTCVDIWHVICIWLFVSLRWMNRQRWRVLQ